MKDPAKCLDLIVGIDYDYTDSGFLCKYFEDGGLSGSSPCKNSIISAMCSWKLSGGVCMTCENNCTIANQAADSDMKMWSGPECQNYEDGEYFTVESLGLFPTHD